MTTVLGCIADDFTGATDIAGLLARSGVKVSLRIGIPNADPTPNDTAAFEVIALKSRTAPVHDAIAEARAALAWLQKTGAQRFFWKYCSTFDSTETGNIGPVAEALMADLGTEQTIYCPAFPENGRTVFMSNLFVGTQPLSESPMKDHPLTPMRDSNLVRLLAPQTTKHIGAINRLVVAKGENAVRDQLSAFKSNDTSHVVIDAVAQEDMVTIAAACRDMPLMTGGSAVAMPLPALYLADGTLSADAPKLTPPKLDIGSIVLSGSCSAMTRAQVSEFIDAGAVGYRLDPIELDKNGPDAARDWLTSQTVDARKIIYATADPEDVAKSQSALGVEKAGKVVEDALAILAKDALELGARRFVVAGGETSGAVTQSLGVDRMTIGREIAAGVPWTYCQSHGHDIALTLKSGNFGDTGFFNTALDILDDDQ